MLARTILLIDDDRLVLESVRAMLEATGHRVLVTDSAEQALVLTREVDPDVVVSDYRMPAIDGLSLANKLMELTPPPRMLIYSAEPWPSYPAYGKYRDVRWVAKSSDHAALLAALEEILEA